MILAEASQGNWLQFMGHFHPMLVHLPIGMLYIAGILHFFAKEKTSPSTVIRILLWTCGFSIISAALGWSLAQSGEYDPSTLQIHQWLGVSTCLLSAGLAYAMYAEVAHRLTNVLFILCLACLSVAGHYGGNLTHGSDYLTESLPATAREMLGITHEESVAVPKITNLPEAQVYGQLIKPLLNQRCVSCHNDQKQKGNLRLDSPEFILLGGENGKILSAGKPLDSELIKRLLLDANDEHHMPPKGKTPLTENEITLLHWWIQNGADFTKKVSQLPTDEKIKKVLSSFSNASEESPVFTLSIDAADEADLAIIRKHGLIANPIAKDQPFIEVNALNAPGITPKQLTDLSRIQDQIVELKLGGTQIGSDFIKDIAAMPLLILLDLNHTKIADQDLEGLQHLAYLESLNLVGTGISDKGFNHIAKIKSLKRVYLWQTKASEKGILQLKKIRPDLVIQSGFKGRWPLEVDSAQAEPAK